MTHRQTALAKALLPAAPTRGAPVTQAQPAVSFPLWPGRLTNLRVHKHVCTYESLEYQHDPSVHPAPPTGPQPSELSHGSPTCQLDQLAAPNMQHSHTWPRGSTQCRNPRYQDSPFTHPGKASWSSVSCAGGCTHWFVGNLDARLPQQPALGTPAVGCCPAPAADMELLTPLTHAVSPSNWFCGPADPTTLVVRRGLTGSSSCHRQGYCSPSLNGASDALHVPGWHQTWSLSSWSLVFTAHARGTECSCAGTGQIWG